MAAAAALKKADPDLKLHIFERTRMQHKGAAVLVGVNGLLALEAIDRDLLDGLLQKAIRLEGSDRYNMHTGEWIEYNAMSNDKFKELYGYHNALLGWSDITAALAAGLPADSITTSCPITAYREQPDGTIQLFGGGSSINGVGADSTQQQQQEQEQQVIATCKVLIGADGWFSAIRQQLLADGPPTFKDAVVYRARIKRPDGMPAERTKWWVPPSGPNSAESLAVLIPVPGGDLVWQCHAPLKVMQEKGLGFDPVKGEAVSSHSDTSSSGSKQGVKERCLKAFETFPPAFLDVVKATSAEAITEHGLYQRTADSIPEDAWGQGRVTLVGDAAHTAYVDGTGLALSLEDAAVLGWHVQQAGLTAAALRAFEAERIPRVKEVFGMGDRHAAKMKEGIPQRELLQERAELLYGKAKFKPLKQVDGKVASVSAAVPAGAVSA